LGSAFVAKFGAKSSYGLLPLWIHHKIDKTNIAQHKSSGCPQFLKKTKMMGKSPPAQFGPAHNAGPFSIPGEISPKREF
jgi:hypothetical protein